MSPAAPAISISSNSTTPRAGKYPPSLALADLLKTVRPLLRPTPSASSPKAKKVRRVAIVFGAGINFHLADITDPATLQLITWRGFLRHLGWYPIPPPDTQKYRKLCAKKGALWSSFLEPLYKTRKAQENFIRRASLTESMLENQPDAERFAAIAHLIRHEMKTGYRSDTEPMDLWEPAMREVMQKLCSMMVKSKWDPVLKRAGELCRQGKVKLITTNFDPLIALKAGLPVMATPDASTAEAAREQPLDLWHPDKKDGTGRPVPTSLRDYGLLEWLPLVWEGWGTEKGPLKASLAQEVASVFHAHGWGGSPNGIIFGTVDYHEAGKAAAIRQCPNDLIERLLSDHCLTLFVGTSEGLMDSHLLKIWSNASDRTLQQGLGNNWWLLNRHFDGREHTLRYGKNVLQKWRERTMSQNYSRYVQPVWHGKNDLADEVPKVISQIFKLFEGK